jgi:hypothetical protein
MSAPKNPCTFSILHSVRAIKIRGEGGGGLTLPKDGGCVQRFLRWPLKNEIYDVGLLGGSTGGGSLTGFFYEKDVDRIKAWLEKDGAVEDFNKTWERRGG